MSGKIILNLALSLDGYIASEDGGYDWIKGHGDSTLNTDKNFDFQEFLKDIHVVVMGKRCYDQGMHKDYPEKIVYVSTNSPLEDYENIRFIKGNITQEIIEECRKNKNVYLFGGGLLIDPFIKKDLIDEYIIGIIPTILGKGIPLFQKNNPTLPLHLKSCTIEDGVTVMKYIRRK